MTLLKDFGDISDKFYNNFLLRDMAYIFSGALIILTVIFFGVNSDYDIDTEFVSKTFKNLSGIVEFFLIFFTLSVSYYLGLMNQEFWVFTGIIRIYPCKKGHNFVEKETTSIRTSMNAINSNFYNEDSLRTFERIKVIKNNTAAVGSALLTILVLTISQLCKSIELINNNSSISTPVLVILAFALIGSVSSNWRKAQVQDSIENDKKIQGRNENDEKKTGINKAD